MTKYFERIEFRFWNLIVRLLSDNETIRALVKNTYQFFNNPEITSDRALIGIISLSGMLFGISLSVIFSFMF
jgi:hypothetical protein